MPKLYPIVVKRASYSFSFARMRIEEPERRSNDPAIRRMYRG